HIVQEIPVDTKLMRWRSRWENAFAPSGRIIPGLSKFTPLKPGKNDTKKLEHLCLDSWPNIPSLDPSLSTGILLPCNLSHDRVLCTMAKRSHKKTTLRGMAAFLDVYGSYFPDTETLHRLIERLSSPTPPILRLTPG